MFFCICFGVFRLCMIIRKLIILNASDWECLAAGFWAMASGLSATILYEQ